MDELDRYNGDEVHDMWVDYTTHEYTDELDEYFEEDDSDDEYYEESE